MLTNYKAPHCEMKKIAKDVYAFLQPPSGFTSNAGLVVGEKFAVVFDSFTNKFMAENFLSKIKAVTNKPVRFLINSHWHTDHIWTNHYFKEATVITSQRNREETLKLPEDDVERVSKWLTKMSFEGAKTTPQDMTFEGKFSIYDGKREIRLIDMGPGHSQSDVIMYLPKEKVIFCGDLLCVGMVPAGVEQIFYGSFRVIHVLDALAGMDAELFVTGHGPVLAREQAVKIIAGFIEFYITLRDEARRLFNTGRSLEEAYLDFDWSKFNKWSTRDKIENIIWGNLRRAFSEFRGEPPGHNLDKPGFDPKVNLPPGFNPNNSVFAARTTK